MPEPKEALYEINQPIKFKYRCNGNPATAEPIVEVLDEEGNVDAQVPILELISGRIFKSSFTPDAVGVWTVHITDNNGGDVIKDFAVASIGVQTMAQAVVTIDGKIDAVDDKIDNLAADSGGAHFA